MKTYFETKELKDKKDFADNPTLYGKKLSKVMDMVSEEMSTVTFSIRSNFAAPLAFSSSVKLSR